MNTLIVCFALAALGQAWDAPLIQEAELAAPDQGREVVEQPSPPRQRSESESWDLDSQGDADRQGRPLREENGAGTVTFWEYDDNSRPVLRVSPEPPAEKAVESRPKPAEVNKETEQPAEVQEAPRRSRPVATFWIILPRR